MRKNKRLYKILMVCADLSILPLLYLCGVLSGVMLDFIPDTCMYAKIGAKCITCGGTHFVKSLSEGKIVEAFNHNQFLFLLMLFLAVAYIFVNIYILSDSRFAKNVLSKMFSFPVLYTFIGILVVFLLLRNIPFYNEVIINIKKLLRM